MPEVKNVLKVPLLVGEVSFEPGEVKRVDDLSFGLFPQALKNGYVKKLAARRESDEVSGETGTAKTSPHAQEHHKKHKAPDKHK